MTSKVMERAGMGMASMGTPAMGTGVMGGTGTLPDAKSRVSAGPNARDRPAVEGMKPSSASGAPRLSAASR